MGAHTYLDFDLQIDDLGNASYRAYVLASPAGQAEVFFDLPFSALELENFFLRIGRPRRGVRRVNSPEMNEARKFGGKLYDTVFQGSLHACLLLSIDYAEQRELGIRLRLRLPPSLIELPWEYLYDPAQVPAPATPAEPARTPAARPARRSGPARWALLLIAGVLVIAGGLALWRWNGAGVAGVAGARQRVTGSSNTGNAGHRRQCLGEGGGSVRRELLHGFTP